MGVTSGSWLCTHCNFHWTHSDKCLFCGEKRAGYQPPLMLDRPRYDEIKVIGPLPPSVSYLHALAANGQGDMYDWTSGRVEIQICDADRRKEQLLNPVDKVVLNYNV